MSVLRVLWPQTLRARLILLILGAVLFAQALTLYAIALHQRDQAQTAAVNLLVTSIKTLQAALGSIEPGKRAEFVELTSQGQWKLVQRDPPRYARFQSERGLEPASQDDPQLRQSLRGMAREINRSLGRGSRVAIAVGEQPYLYVALAAVNGQIENAGPRAGGLEPRGPTQWLRIPLDRVDPPLTTATLAGWLGSLGALLLVAVGFSWHITRPMTQLLRATDQLAAGRPERVVPSGPIETRQLGERFNAMLGALEQSERTQRTLLAGLPHDLKGPLSRMALRIEMSDDADLQQGLKRDLSDMQRMVEQFLAYIRGQDMGSLKLEPLRLDAWLGGRMDDMQRLKKPVVLTGQLASVTVRADIDALDRLLTNLVDNALEHGFPPVEIGLEVHSDQAVLSVTDHGVGIAPEDRQRALEPFARLDKARTRTGNVGLGLSVVQAIASGHGGSVSLGQGASGGLQVRVCLPVARA